jgi:hypothetical protein
MPPVVILCPRPSAAHGNQTGGASAGRQEPERKAADRNCSHSKPTHGDHACGYASHRDQTGGAATESNQTAGAAAHGKYALRPVANGDNSFGVAVLLVSGGIGTISYVDQGQAEHGLRRTLPDRFVPASSGGAPHWNFGVFSVYNIRSRHFIFPVR